MHLRSWLTGIVIVCATAAPSAQSASVVAPAPPASAGTADQAAAPDQPPPPIDTRTQYPAFLSNSYFGFDIGSIRYLFSTRQLEPGYQTQSVAVPHLGVRVDLFGHQFFKYLSAQVVYIRPARYVTYSSINGDQIRHEVGEAIGGVTLMSAVPLTARVSIYGEGGWGITSRAGFTINGQTVVKDARFSTGLFGGGLVYHATRNVDVLVNATYAPGRASLDQPSTRLFSTGLRYHMRPLPEAEVEENREAGLFFPANLVRVGFTSGASGYGLNTFFSSTVPIFWGGTVRADTGITADFQHNVFHTRKRFAFDIGTSASFWTSLNQRDTFRTLSVYPLFRFMLVRTHPADVYATYSLAGPTYISRTIIDTQNVGAHFTFQDFIAVGAFIGRAHRLDVELGIKHYSNGNIFPRNAAIRIPLTLSFGLVF
jgi:Lipid A 3-O-deacylase (PagL)